MKFLQRLNHIKKSHPLKLAVASMLLLGVLLIIINHFVPFTHCKSKDSYTNHPGQNINSNVFSGTVEAFESIRVGANSYKVHEDLTDPKFAAQTMDQLNTTAQKLIRLLNSKYIDNQQGMDSIKPEYRDIVSKGIVSVTKNFKAANMEENIPERSGGDTSYVIDKGDVFAMCLRDPNNNNLVDVSNDMNELNFVLIHEMAHLFTSTFGHDTMFWNNFKFMLQEASIAGLYTPINYKKNKQPYCGIVISYSPLYDSDLKEYVIRQV